jgi:hypothetical protein
MPMDAFENPGILNSVLALWRCGLVLAFPDTELGDAMPKALLHLDRYLLCGALTVNGGVRICCRAMCMMEERLAGWFVSQARREIWPFVVMTCCYQ